MPNPDPAQLKARKANIAVVKAAIKKAAGKNNAGGPIWVGFAFSQGDKPDHHTFMMSPRKKGPALGRALTSQLAKEAQEAKKKGAKESGAAPKICFGQATVGKAGGKGVIWIEYIKKLNGAERKMNEALKLMHLPFLVKLLEEDDTGEAPAAPPPLTEEDENDTDDTPDEVEAAGEDSDETEEEPGEEDTEGEEPDAAEDEDTEGDADQEDEEEEPAQAAAATTAAQQPQRTSSPYKDGAVVWSKTRTLMHANVAKFKAAVQQEYKDEPPELQTEINQALAKLDTMLGKFDDRLEASLQKAHDAPDDASRKAELGNAKEFIKSYLKAMAADPLVGQLDKNPFGVDMNIKLVLTKSLTQLSKTVS